MFFGSPRELNYVDTRLDYSIVKETGYSGNSINPNETTSLFIAYI